MNTGPDRRAVDSAASQVRSDGIARDVTREDPVEEAFDGVVVDLTHANASDERLVVELTSADASEQMPPVHENERRDRTSPTNLQEHRDQQSPSLTLTRVFDLVVASVGLLLAAPLFLVIAVIIRLDTRGPVFFRQTRVGRDGSHFEMIKFRKMPEDMPTQGPMVTMRYDLRLSRAGRFLERTKLDELPQLINVMRGEMSVIGPRPELPKFVEFYPELWTRVHSVKPGIFSPATTIRRNESELYPSGDYDTEEFYVRDILPDKLRIDAHFAENPALLKNLWILAKGLFVAIFGAVTWRAVASRRMQIVNLIFMWSLGVASLAASLALTGHEVSSPVVRDALILSVLIQPLVLLGFRLPMTHTASMNASDYMRIMWCALTSTWLLMIGLLLMGHQDLAGPTLIVGFFVYLGSLFGYKLLMYSAYLTFRAPGSSALAQRVVVAAAILGPLAALLAIAITQGRRVVAGDDLLHYAGLLLAASTIHAGTILVLRAPGPHVDTPTWLAKEGPRLAVLALMGSWIILAITWLVVEWRVTAATVVIEAAIFATMILAFAVWQNARPRTHIAISRQDRAELATANLVIVGSGIQLSSYVASFDRVGAGQYHIAGLISSREQERMSSVSGHRVIGGVGDVPQILSTIAVDIVVALTSTVGVADRSYLENIATLRGCRYVEIEFAPENALNGHSLRASARARDSQLELFPVERENGNRFNGSRDPER